MRDQYFVDTSFLVARYNEDDAHHARAMALLDELANRSGPGPRLVLSDYVFDEMITTILARTHRHSIAATAGQAVRRSRAGEVVVVDREVVEAAWALFLNRPD